MITEITARNAAVLESIRDYFRATGRAPTIGDLSAATGLGKTTIHYHLRRLKAAGRIIIRTSEPRGIELPNAVSHREIAAELALMRSRTTRDDWEREYPMSARFLTDHQSDEQDRDSIGTDS